MVVGVHELHDVKFDRKATITINRRIYQRIVYGDKRVPNRRDLFPSRSMSLPKSANVNWMGKTYLAKLSFRTGIRGIRIPVFTWDVES